MSNFTLRLVHKINGSQIGEGMTGLFVDDGAYHVLTRDEDLNDLKFSEIIPILVDRDGNRHDMSEIIVASEPTPVPTPTPTPVEDEQGSVGEVSPTPTPVPTPPVGASNGHIAMPDAAHWFATLADAERFLRQLRADPGAGVSAIGASLNAPLVIGLKAGQHGDMNWQDIGPFPMQVTLRGEGPFGDDGYAPTAGTNVERIRWDRVRGLELMGMVAEPKNIGDRQTLPHNGNDNHRFVNCDNWQITRCAILGDIARSAAELRTRCKNGVFRLIHIDNPDANARGYFRNCVFGGSQKAVFGGRGAKANNIWIEGAAYLQNGGDIIQFVGEGETNGWGLFNNFGMGTGRAPAADHRDFIHFDTVVTPHKATGWVIDGLWNQDMGATGVDSYVAIQSLWSRQAITSGATCKNLMHATPGKSVNGRWGGLSLTDSTVMCPIDTLGSDSRDGQGTRADTWSADFATPSMNSGIGTHDRNLIFGRGGSNGLEGPNGQWVQSAGFVQFQEARGIKANWDAMGAFLENYQGTPALPLKNDYDTNDSAATNGKYTVSPRAVGGIGVEQYKPKTGTVMHWEHKAAIGAHDLLRRVFDPVDADNPWTWKWPTSVAMKVDFDPTQAMGGAGQSTFDENGD